MLGLRAGHRQLHPRLPPDTGTREKQEGNGKASARAPRALLSAQASRPGQSENPRTPSLPPFGRASGNPGARSGIKHGTRRSPRCRLEAAAVALRVADRPAEMLLDGAGRRDEQCRHHRDDGWPEVIERHAQDDARGGKSDARGFSHPTRTAGHGGVYAAAPPRLQPLLGTPLPLRRKPAVAARAAPASRQTFLGFSR
jgi:hypothetical protein